MKRFYFILFCVAGIINIYANTSANGLSYDGRWLSINDSIVIVEDSLQFVTITMEDENKRNSFDHWSISGDLKVNPDYTANSYSIQISSRGSGKGRLTYIYNQVGCGSMSVSIDIYKRFNPNVSPYNIEISGPDCVLEGDTVVYSIKPILTKNLTQGIGVDEYFWNVADTTPEHKKPFVDRLIYNAGDGSSVTFIAGEVSGNDTIKVQVGLANADALVIKPLGKASPKPLVKDTCIPFDQTVLELNIYNEEYPDLVYTWDYSPKWDPAGYPSYDDNVQKRYHVILYPDTGYVGTITVTASYGDDDACASASRATFNLSRSWGESAKITPQVVYAKNGGEYIKFQLSKDSVPEMTPIWELPKHGWNLKPGTDKNQFTYYARPDSSIQYIDTIEVWAESCYAKDSCLAFVHLAPARVDSISELTCLVPGNTYTFSVEHLEVGPRPTGYTWYINGDSVYTSEENTYTRSFTSNMTSIAVRSLGQNGWNADTTQIELSYSAIAPSQMSSDNTCLFAGREDIIKFTVHDRKPGYTYSWVYPSTWRDIEDEATDSTITLITDGRSGTQQVGVYAEYLAACGKSDTLYKNVLVDTITYYIAYEIQYGGALHVFTLRDSLAHTNVFTDDWEVDGNPLSLSAPVNQIFLMQYAYPNLSHVKATVIREDSCPMPAECPVGASQIKHRTSLNQEQINQTDFSLYPNPAQETITFTKDDDARYNVIIFGLDGKKLKSIEMKGKSLTINISDLPVGDYYVVMTDGHKHSAKKMIKNY